MITLVTGVPGAGKTLWTVNQLRTKLLKENRPIFSNINGLAVDDPNVKNVDDDYMQKWMDAPHGSIFIFDECQTAYRPRAAGAKVPPYISEFETHRHKGFDFYLITQNPGFLDKNVRELVGRHVHLYRPFGLKRSQVFEWPTYNPTPNPTMGADNAAKSQFFFSSKDYGLYKSSVQHTVKVRLPMGLLLTLVVAFVAFLVCGYYGASSLGIIPPGTASAAVTEPPQPPEGLAGVDPINRSQQGPQEASLAGNCRYRGRIGSTLLVTHSKNGNLAVPRESVLDTCAQLY